MRPEAPFSRPVAICSCITVLILFRRSREKPACSGAAVGKLAPTTNDATKQKTKRIRMSANLSQRQAPRVRHVTKQWAAELGPAVKPRDNAFREVTHRPRADHRSAQIPVRIAASFGGRCLPLSVMQRCGWHRGAVAPCLWPARTDHLRAHLISPEENAFVPFSGALTLTVMTGNSAHAFSRRRARDAGQTDRRQTTSRRWKPANRNGNRQHH